LGPSMPLFGETFYQNAARVTGRQGLLVRQTGSAFLQGDELASAVRRARSVFPCVQVFLTAVPTYIGGYFTHPMMSLTDFSRRLRPAALRRRFAKNPLATRYYTPELHAAAFVLPEYIRQLCAET
jgi:spermidine synthase